MSATGRGQLREQQDAYNTQDVLAHALIERLLLDGYAHPATEYAMEPSAGTGSFVRAMRELINPRRLWAVDLRTPVDFPEATQTIRKDFLEVQTGNLELISGNPPFELAEPHIRHAHELLCKGGTLAFLLRLAFLEGGKREVFWKKHPPVHAYILRSRPSFKVSDRWKVTARIGGIVPGNKWTNVGSFNSEAEAWTHVRDFFGNHETKVKRTRSKTDSAAYAFFVWRKGGGSWPCSFEIIDWK